MKNKFKIIETPDYILAVSDEEIKEGDLVYENNLNQETTIYQIQKRDNKLMFFRFRNVPIWLDRNQHNCKKIIAYQPKGNAPELDLPLLPSFKKEIVGYKLKPNIDRLMVDGILKYPMPIWNDKDKSVYFIRGHVAGSLVAKMKELQVLDLWFTPIYEEVKSDWVKEHHLEYYYKEGIMSDEIVVEDDVEKLFEELYGIPLNSNANRRKEGFIGGYKAATKVYSEEDLRKAWNMAFEESFNKWIKATFKSFIQSLKQPTPKWFVAETITINKGYTDKNDYPYQECEVFKTTTVNGKKYLIGTYLYN
jgi:hypothetical protein